LVRLIRPIGSTLLIGFSTNCSIHHTASLVDEGSKH
jgi:hypothetical protein